MSVRVLFAVSAVAACLSSSSAFAGGLIERNGDKSGPYVAVFGGGVFLDESDYAGPGGAFSVDTDTGYDFGGAIGYALPFRALGVFQPRYEIEVSYLESDVSDAGSAAATGDAEALSIFFNGYYDIRLAGLDRLTPYVGGGAGVAFVDLDVTALSSSVPFATADDTVFAGHVAAGATFALSERLELFGEGRYFRSSRVETAFASPAAFIDRERLEGFVANGGLRWRF